MPNTYITPFDYVNGTTGVEWQSLVGNMARFTAQQSLGATSLTVPATGPNSISVQLKQFDTIYIFDGSSTEVLLVDTPGAAPGATSIPILNSPPTSQPLQFAHNAGTAWCSPGFTSAGTPTGSLGDRIINASSWFESACAQPLLQTTWTSELLALGTMRASIDENGNLFFRPRHWPIQSISALTIIPYPGFAVAYDTTFLFLDSDRQVVTAVLVPLSSQQGGGQAYIIPPDAARYSRRTRGQVQITYISGYAYSNLPGDIKEAVIMVTSDQASIRYNPTGAVEVDAGGTRLIMGLRGDLSGDSELMKKVNKTVVKYTAQSF